MEELCICCHEFSRRPPEVRLLSPKARVQFCDYCDGAGCDAVNPCKVPASEREDLRKALAIDDTFQVIREMELHWLESLSSGTLQEIHKGSWVMIVEGYWRRETETVIGLLVSEVLQIKQVPGYTSQARIALAVDSTRTGQWVRHFDASSLQEAQANCAVLIARLINYQPSQYDFSIHFPLKTNSEEKYQ